MKLNLDNSFDAELPGDKNKENTRRQVHEACFSLAAPRVPGNPKVIHVSKEMAFELGISSEDMISQDFTEVFTGKKIMSGSKPYAMCYGGHQFGQWAGQLGDGRAINLGEVMHQKKRWALQLKGAGETPYSRSADGLAVLRSSIREHLCSEAMYHMGVPTTRSLSLSLTGDKVLRDAMYDGNSAYEKGAVVCRAAESFLRFGNFQIFAFRQDTDRLKILTDYTIRHFFKNVKEGSKEGYLAFFKEVVDRTLDMIVHWQRVGFVHGVMNTDNMSILGLTIDYGPYGWLEGYDHSWTPNTTDRANKRYRYGHQPRIALWNLLQLANALFPLIEEAKLLEEILNGFGKEYSTRYLAMMRKKLGLAEEKDEDQLLIDELEKTLHLTETDMTIFFRKLAFAKKENPNEADLLSEISEAFYEEDLDDAVEEKWETWIKKYLFRLQEEKQSDEERKKMMDATNPKYVLRNYMAQLAIDAADEGDYSIIEELHQVLKKPYDEQAEAEKWFQKRPEWARHKVGCSMLSCSS